MKVKEMNHVQLNKAAWEFLLGLSASGVLADAHLNALIARRVALDEEDPLFAQLAPPAPKQKKGSAPQEEARQFWKTPECKHCGMPLDEGMECGDKVSCAQRVRHIEEQTR